MQVLVNKNNIYTNLKTTLPLLSPGPGSWVLPRLHQLSSAGRSEGHSPKPAASLWGFLLLTSFPCSSVGSPGWQLPWVWSSLWAEVGVLSEARQNLVLLSFLLLLLRSLLFLTLFVPCLYLALSAPSPICGCHTGSVGVVWDQLCWAWNSSSQSSQRPLLDTCTQYKIKGNI